VTCIGTLALNNISLRIMYRVSERLPGCRSQADCAGALYGRVLLADTTYHVIGCHLTRNARDYLPSHRMPFNKE
jgi:hypothetical protein